MRYHVYLLIMLAAMPTAVVWATETNQPTTLTLDDCLDEAVRHQPDVAAAKEALQRAEFQYRAAMSAFLPQLSANASADRSSVASGSNVLVNNSYTANLQAQESLYSGGHDTALLAQRTAEREVACEQYRLALAQLSFDVRVAFARQLYAVDLIEQTSVIVKRRAGNADLVALRYEGGREHKGSLLRMQAILSQARLDQESAQRALDVARQRLARALGREMPVAVINGSLVCEPPETMADCDKLAEAVPDVRIAAAQAKAAKAGVRVAKSEYFPTITAAGSVSRSDDVFFPQNDGWSVGVQLNYPFFSGGRNIMDVRTAQSDERRFAWLLRSQWQQTLTDLRQAYSDWLDAYQRLSVQKEFLQAATIRAEIARNQYTTGLLSFDNWDIIENDLITQQKAELTARRDAALAQAAWEKARGISLLPAK
ncbi:MAG: TolC family protein [Verrucomicrobia bacterium]|nr:MAG: TolC family protein [Verrucomicrobiota bacterium]